MCLSISYDWPDAHQSIRIRTERKWLFDLFLANSFFKLFISFEWFKVNLISYCRTLKVSMDFTFCNSKRVLFYLIWFGRPATFPKRLAAVDQWSSAGFWIRSWTKFLSAIFWNPRKMTDFFICRLVFCCCETVCGFQSFWVAKGLSLLDSSQRVLHIEFWLVRIV